MEKNQASSSGAPPWPGKGNPPAYWESLWDEGESGDLEASEKRIASYRATHQKKSPKADHDQTTDEQA